MRDDEYEELFDTHESLTEKSTILRGKTNPQDFVLRKKTTLADTEEYKRVLKEVLQRKKLEHSNLTNLIRVNIDSPLQTITSYYEHSQYSATNVGCDNIAAVMQLAVEGLRGLVHLHQNHLVHGDVRPENLCFFEEGQIFKLTEKPSWKPAAELQRDHIDTGAPLYMDPSMFNEICNRAGGTNLNVFKNDVFAMGLVIVQAADPELLDLDKVYDGKYKLFNYSELMLQLNSGVARQSSTDHRRFIELIAESMLDSKRQDRISSERALVIIQDFARTLHLTSPSFTLRPSSLYGKSAKSVYLGVCSDQFKSQDINQAKISTPLSAYIRKSMEAHRKSSIKESSASMHTEKLDRSLRSPVVGFVGNVHELSETSVDYPDRGTIQQMIKTETPTRFREEAQRISEQRILTHKKLLKTNKSEEDLVIEIRSSQQRQSREQCSEIIELSLVDDFVLKYSKGDNSQIEVNYTIGQQSCRRIIPATVLAEKSLIVQIKRSKSHTPIRGPLADVKTINEIHVGGTKPQMHQTVELRKNIEKLSQSFARVPLNFKARLIEYKVNQSQQSLSRTGADSAEVTRLDNRLVTSLNKEAGEGRLGFDEYCERSRDSGNLNNPLV